MLATAALEVLSAVAPDVRPFNLTEYYFSNESHSRPGIWKVAHYLPIYDRHFSRFRGTDVHFLEVGVHSGGSLRMSACGVSTLARGQSSWVWIA